MSAATSKPPNKARVQFMDGAAGDDVVRLFVACDLVAGNYDFTRLCVFREKDEWAKWDVNFTVVSVGMHINPQNSFRTIYALGRDGRVWEKLSGIDPTIAQIPDAGTGKGKYGYLLQVRFIGTEPYICGDQGQVYRKQGQSWVHCDAGVLTDDDSVSLNSIDGTSPEDIYVVGDKGRMFHFNGSSWTDVSFPTNLILARVRCVDRDHIYVCGQNGLLIVGNHRGWKRIDHEENIGEFWDLEYFGGQLWLVADGRLVILDGDKLIPVDTKLSPKPDAHHLSTNGRVLWSIGENDLVVFDGSRWTRVIYPDNR
jgi:hypothetical protein